jgi:hypothetical protein
MSYLQHTNTELQAVIDHYVAHHNPGPSETSSKSSFPPPNGFSPPQPKSQEELDCEACEKYIIENQDTLISGSSYIVVDHGKVTAYRSFPEAYPHVQGRDDLYEYKYRGWPPKPIRFRKVTRPFGNENCMFTPVKIWYRPTGVNEHQSLDDIKMMVDTGASESLGPVSVLTNLGIQSKASGRAEIWDRTSRQTRSIKVELEIEGPTPKSSIRIPVAIDYWVPDSSDEKFDIERINQDRTDQDEWLLGMGFLKYCKHIWEDTTQVSFTLSKRYQLIDGSFTSIPNK